MLARAEIDHAIAGRLRTADFVDIEEYYDASGKGHAGVNADEKSTKVGIGGEGQRIVKRRIILKGSVSDGQVNTESELQSLEAATKCEEGLISVDGPANPTHK